MNDHRQRLQLDEHGQLESADGMPGTSAADGSAIPPAAAHFRQAADCVQRGDAEGARHAARQALQILEGER